MLQTNSALCADDVSVSVSVAINAISFIDRGDADVIAVVQRLQSSTQSSWPGKA